MLSRIADAMFWIGRYVERADQTSRILDVDLQAVTENSDAPVAESCREVYAVFGLTGVPEADLTVQRALDRLAVDRANPSSIAGSLRVARENARGAREVLSTEVWESLNTTSLDLPRSIRVSRMHGYFRWSRDRCAVIAGQVDNSMIRDEAWLFWRVGQLLERLDMLSRTLQIHRVREASDGETVQLLRVCSAHEAYIRSYRGQVEADDALQFLLLDRLFPRSIAHCLEQLDACLEQLTMLHGHAFDRMGTEDPGRRAVGQALASLRFRPLEDIEENLEAEMERLQTVTRRVSGALAASYLQPLDLAERD